MPKGTIRATKASDGTVNIASRPSQKVIKRIGAAPSRSLVKAFEKGSRLTKTALLAILTTKGSRLSVEQARKEADQIFKTAQPIRVKEILKNKQLTEAQKAVALLDLPAKQVFANKSSKIIEGYKNPTTQALGAHEMFLDPDLSDFIEKSPKEHASLFEALTDYVDHLREIKSPKLKEYDSQLEAFKRQTRIAAQAVEEAKAKSKKT
jgi:hypothetical protein